MAIPVEWKASITGAEDVKGKLREIDQQFKQGLITQEEYAQKKRFLNGVTRSHITTLSQERNILLATHPALNTVSKAMSTLGRVTSSALSIMNAFNLANLVTQGQSQQAFQIKLEIIDSDKTLAQLQEELAKDPNNKSLQIAVKFELAKNEELRNAAKALAEEEGKQFVNNLIVGMAGLGTAVSTTFSALMSIPSVATALIQAGTLAGGIFSGFFVFASRPLIIAGTWLTSALITTRSIAGMEGMAAGRVYGLTFIGGVVSAIAAAIAAGLLVDILTQLVSGKSPIKDIQKQLGVKDPKSTAETLGIPLPEKEFVSGLAQETRDAKGALIPGKSTGKEVYIENWKLMLGDIEGRVKSFWDSITGVNQTGVDMNVAGFNILGTGVNGAINQLISNYNRIARKTKQPTLEPGTFNPITAKSIRAASGFEGIVNGPTSFLAGEAGSEHVSITPVNKSGGGQSVIQYITVQGSILAERDVEMIAGKALKRDLKRVGF
jgi:hypothetical protein